MSYKPFHALRTCFPTLKDKPSALQCRGVIYMVSCVDCNFVYYGQTNRALVTRLNEHKRAVRVGDSKSKIAQHANRFVHSIGRLPFDENFRNFRNGDKWYVIFQRKVPENPEIVEFPKRKPFNRKFRKFSDFFYYLKLVLWATITASWTSHARMMGTRIRKWTNILVWNLATCLSVL